MWVVANTVRALTLASDVDLAVFCAYLAQQSIPHRVFEEQGRQVLEVPDKADAARVQAAYAAWREGRLTLQWKPQEKQSGRSVSWWPLLRRYPVVTGLIAVSILCLPATWPLDQGTLGRLLPWLTIVPVGVDGPLHYASLQASLQAMLASMQWWRVVTPIFIHFGIAHLAFNAAVVIEFGRRIERGAGSLVLLLLTLLVAVTGNVAQFLVTQAPLFGGLSGVAYGLFGYVAMRGRFNPAAIWYVTPSFTIAVLVMLVLMTTGVTEIFGLHIANTVHWVGLAVGALAALLWRPVRDPADAEVWPHSDDR